MNKIEQNMFKIALSGISDNGIAMAAAKIAVDLARQAWRSGHFSGVTAESHREFDEWLEEYLKSDK